MHRSAQSYLVRFLPVLSCRVEYWTENFLSAERPQDLGDENSAVVHCWPILRSNDDCAAPPVCNQAM